MENTDFTKVIKASEVAVDTEVNCINPDWSIGNIRRFAGCMNGKLYAFYDGRTSNEGNDVMWWPVMLLLDGTRIIPE